MTNPINPQPIPIIPVISIFFISKYNKNPKKAQINPKIIFKLIAVYCKGITAFYLSQTFFSLL